MADEQGAIPEGMKAWAGGDAAPEDWDGGRVWLERPSLASYPASRWAGSNKNRFSDLVDWRHGVPGIVPVIAYTPAADRPTDTGEVLPTDRYGMTVLDRMRDTAENGTMPPEYRKDLFALLDLATPKPPVDAGAMREALEAWRLKDGYVPAYIAGWNVMLDQALAIISRNLPVAGETL